MRYIKNEGHGQSQQKNRKPWGMYVGGTGKANPYEYDKKSDAIEFENIGTNHVMKRTKKKVSSLTK